MGRRRPSGDLALIHISEPTRRTPTSYADFCLKKKKVVVTEPVQTGLSHVVGEAEDQEDVDQGGGHVAGEN